MEINLKINDPIEIEWIKSNQKYLNKAFSIGIQSLMLGELNNNNINDIIERSVKKEISPINNIIEEVFNIKKSYQKGVVGEKIPINYLKKLYPSNEIIENTKNAHEADCQMKIDGVGDILYEFKYYNNIVNKKEIDKFYNDIDRLNIKYGIFISHNSGIVGRKYNIEWEIYNEKLIIFVSNFGLIETGIELSTNLLLYMIKNNFIDNNYKIIKMENNSFMRLINDIINNIINEIKSINIILDKIKNIKTQLNNSMDGLYELLDKSKNNIKENIFKYEKYIINYDEKDNISKDNFFNYLNNNIYKNYIEKLYNQLVEKDINISFQKNNINILKDNMNIMNIEIKDNIYIKYYIKDNEIISYNSKYESIEDNLYILSIIKKENIENDDLFKLILNKL